MSEGILERSDITKLLQDERNAGYNSGYTAGKNSSPLSSKLKAFSLQTNDRTASITVRDGSSGWYESTVANFPYPTDFDGYYPFLVHLSSGYLQFQSGEGVFASSFDGTYYWLSRDSDRSHSPLGSNTFSGTFVSLPSVLLAPMPNFTSVGLVIYSRGYRKGTCTFNIHLQYQYFTTKLT